MSKIRPEKVFILIVLLAMTVAFVLLYRTAGFGKCRLGQTLVFNETVAEGCVDIGTKITPSFGYLKIIASPWTGWTEEQPQEIESKITILKNNQKIKLEGWEGHELTVIEPKKDSIILSTGNLGLKGENEKSGIDLNQCGYHEIEIKVGKTINLHTCTMDAGCSWNIRYNIGN
ncbi:MAG TPA: hypothetical protein VMW41_02360 [Candidatus Bathyarchaeia archaeon]|nr:hypothetical protein [Candidatus Bathyarchaeia archaeon]